MYKKLKSVIVVTAIISISCNPKIETTSPQIKNISESVYASGIVKSQNQYEVFTKINGIIGEIAINEGALIKKNDLLFKIENPNSKLSSDNAKLLSTANDFTVNIGKLNDARNAIELAEKNYLNDSLQYERQKNLWRQNIGSKIDLEKRELSFSKSEVALKQAKVFYSDLKRQLELASSQSKNNLKIAQSLENDLLVKSTIDGVVYKINIQQGELATTMTPLAVIGEKNFIVELYVDEFDIVKIKKGQKVIIRMDSYKSDVFEAEVSTVYPMMNERTRTFKVEASFTKKPEVLYPNLTLEGNIIIKEKKGALTIPSRFLDADTTVLLQNGKKQKIEIGLKDYNLTEIQSGLSENSKIVMPVK